MTANPPRIRFKTIALPTEHGAWGFLLEPIVLALLVAPTAAGVCYALAAAATFLARHPLKLVVKHRAEVTRSRRYRLAAQVATAYVVISIAGLAAAILLAGWQPVLPVVVLSPFVIVFVYHDVKHQGRSLMAELAGPLGLASTAPAIALAAGWSWAPSVAVWILLMARALPSIIYVRARLRLGREQPTNRAVVFWWHLTFAVIVLVLVGKALAPVSALFAFAVLWGRSLLGLSAHMRLTRARQVGVAEIAFGLLYVVIVAAGYRLGF